MVQMTTEIQVALIGMVQMTTEILVALIGMVQMTTEILVAAIGMVQMKTEIQDYYRYRSDTYINGSIQSNNTHQQNSNDTPRSADSCNNCQWSGGKESGHAHRNSGHHGNRGQGQGGRSHGGQIEQGYRK
jgi:hypothetical protein